MEQMVQIIIIMELQILAVVQVLLYQQLVLIHHQVVKELLY